MESKCIVILVFALISVAVAYPADSSRKEKVEDDVEFVPLEKHARPVVFPLLLEQDFGDGDDDDDAFFPESSFGRYNPFGGFYGSMEAMMTRMRNQLSQILNRLPSRNSSAIPDFPELHLPHIGDVDLGKGNTTSVTKIIDGHKVVINETEYNQQDENGDSFFKVRIIDVQPESDETTEKDVEAVSQASTASREVEPLEESIENEISKNKEETQSNYDNLETFDDQTNQNNSPKEYTNNEIEDMSEFDNGIEQEPYRDLSNDLLVNQYMQDAGAPTNPWSESIPDDVDAELNIKDLRRTGGRMINK